MNQNIFDLLLRLLSGLVAALLITPAAINIAKKLDIIDYPGRSIRRIHDKPMPRAGGIAIMASLLVVFIVFKLWNFPDIWKICVPLTVIFAIGLWDDRHGMEALVKLAGQLIAVSILIYFDVRVKFLESQSFFIQLNSTVAYWLDVLITYIWMVGVTNSFNMVDSMDGLAVGLCQTISALFLFISLVSEQTALVYLSAIIFGISTGVAYYNRQPAKTFLGDSGAQSLGFILAAIAILYHPRVTSQTTSWFAPIMFFAVPIFDTSMVTISRVLRGLPFYKANLDHTYHRLVALGWQKNQAVATMHISGVAFGLISIGAVYLPPIAANAVFIAWITMLFSMIYMLEKKFAPYYPILSKMSSDDT